jgi:ATP-dependent DNA ligase
MIRTCEFTDSHIANPVGVVARCCVTVRYQRASSRRACQWRPPARRPGLSGWHEIKHDGLGVIVRKDGERVRLYSWRGSDLTNRFPLIVEAMARMPSCTIDGEAVACDDSGVPSFDLLRRRQRDDQVFLYAFD